MSTKKVVLASAAAAAASIAGYIIYSRRKANSVTVLCNELDSEKQEERKMVSTASLDVPVETSCSADDEGFSDDSCTGVSKVALNDSSAEVQDSALSVSALNFSWSDEVELSEAQRRSGEGEAVGSKILRELQEQDSSVVVDGALPEYFCSTNEEVQQVLSLVQNFTTMQLSPPSAATTDNTKGYTYADSPSVASEGRSENSNDSGKGGSMYTYGGGASGMSPVEEFIEVPPVYEFEIPTKLVGLLIGQKGVAIKSLMEQSGAHIVIRPHYIEEETEMKICSIEGTRDQINSCLRLIRRRFPPSRFPDLKLTPLLPPPITSPIQPSWEGVSQLSLPEGVSCEVTLSSLVTAGHFFVQQPTHPTHSSLARLDQYMLAVYSQHAGVPPLPRPIEADVICAAPVLGGWYRAQTIAACDDATDEVLVRFVDYGGYSKISASDLRQIRNDFVTLPFQACECYLAHVVPVNEEEGWTEEAKKCFEDFALQRMLYARATGLYADDGTPYIELFTSIEGSLGPEIVAINQLLVDTGFAKWATAMTA